MLLEPNDCVRYVGLGTGRVIRHDVRQFQGQERVFAVIEFPHREMTVQLPVGDPKVVKRLRAPLPKAECRALLKVVSAPGKRLARTWDQREESGTAVLKNGGPVEWAALLSSYSTARGDGLSVASSDADIVRGAQEMLAAELAAACAMPYADAFAEVVGAYQRGSVGRGKKAKRPAAELQTA